MAYQYGMVLSMQPLSITLRGITNAAADPSIDVWRTVTLPLLRQATGLSEGFELKVIKRGAEPLVSASHSLSCCHTGTYTLPTLLLALPPQQLFAKQHLANAQSLTEPVQQGVHELFKGYLALQAASYRPAVTVNIRLGL